MKADDGVRPEFICEESYEFRPGFPLRCWKRNGHHGEHLTVVPVVQRPGAPVRVARW